MPGEGLPYRRALHGPGLSPLAELRSGPGVPAWPSSPIEVIEGVRAASRAAMAVLGRARDDILFVDGGTHLGRLPSPVVRDARTRGVRVRRICARAELTAGARDPATAGEIRVLDVVPTTFVVVDAELAISPLTVSEDGQVTSVLVVGKSALFDSAIALADLLWERAQPYATWRARALQQAGPPAQRIARSTLDADARAESDDPPGLAEAEPGGHGQPTPSDRQLLTLLTQGMKDRAIARYLGIGERTVQRRLNRLMTELGAQTRFQAALNAVRRGWL
ncbi:MAG TPA: helix-turn-helix transcriptional regulator [Actinomycetes bacterium]|jgi:DNA-binding CsgD family transcriptional regulator|nr:helix-turn-helix transcriptional regulator [Actinomycetes bacterium]